MGNLYSQEEREEALKLGMKSGQLQRRGGWGSMWTRYMAGEAAGKRSRMGLSGSWPAGARRISWQKMRSYEPPCGRRSRMWKYSRRLSVFLPRAGKSSKAREVSLD